MRLASDRFEARSDRHEESPVPLQPSGCMGVAGRLRRCSPTTMLGIAFRLVPWTQRRKTHARGCGRCFSKLLAAG